MSDQEPPDSCDVPWVYMQSIDDGFADIDARALAKCSKCFDTGTIHESHGEAVNCEAPGCSAVAYDADDAADYQAAMSSGMR